jgi:glycosyltransferase involved in cell wall biosynthesis
MNQQTATLSVIVITRNEAHNLRDCLQSLKEVANEIVVVDSQSTDGTIEIAKEFGAKISQPIDWPGFGLQKNRALDLATSDWVLSIDADERLTPELTQEIKSVLKNDALGAAYQIPRLSWYCGKFIRHGGWHPDYVLRLFKRGDAKFSNDLVHEKLVTNQNVIQVKQLKSSLLHYSFQNFSQVLDKVDRYSTASALQMFRDGKRSTLGKAIGHGLWAFVRTYLLKRSCLDGAQGFALAVSNAEGTYYRYLKLWLLCREAK